MSMPWLLLVVLLLSLLQVSGAANSTYMLVGLGLYPHIKPLLELGNELHRRGHDVVVSTHRAWCTSAIELNLRCRSLGKLPLSDDHLGSVLAASSSDASIFRSILSLANELYSPSAAPVFAALQDVLANETPDLMVVDGLTLGAIAAGDAHSIPMVVNLPTLLPTNRWSSIPSYGTGTSYTMSLWDRCVNMLFPRLLSVALTPAFMVLSQLRYSANLLPHRSQAEILRGRRLLVDTAPGFAHPTELSPLATLVGPLLPPQRLKPLPGLIARWLEGQQPSFVVLVDFGSMPRFEQWQAEAIVEGLTTPGIRVLWNVPNEQRDTLPSTIPPSFRIKTRVPHLEVLAHPTVRVAISHCGLASAQEALYYRVPVLCLPFFGDQPDVAARVEDAGAGLQLDKRAFTAAEVREKVKRLEGNASFTTAAEEVGELLRSAGGTQRAADVCESMMTLGSAHLTTAVENGLPTHKLYQIDVFAVGCALLVVAAVALRGIFAVAIMSFKSVKTEEAPEDDEAQPE